MTAPIRRRDIYMQSEKNSKNIENFETKQQTDNNNDPNFERKLDLITEGTQPFVKQHLLTRITTVNCRTIIAYILAMQVEINPRLRYRLETILKLKQLAEFHHPKSFQDMTREDLISFLDRLRKPDALDPLHKWIGTYENNRIILLRFFKWLYAPSDVEPGQRPKPAVMQNIRRIRRLEKDIYKDTDVWTPEEDRLFCEYCTSLRDKAYLLVARDTGCRAQEMVNMKIKDLVIQQMEDLSHVVKVQVNGKTGTRTVRIYYAYPYLKDWLNVHPFPNVPNAPVFCGTGKKNTGRRIQPHTVWKIFEHYKEVVFPKLLEDRVVKPEHVPKIKELLKKPWNPHWRRHVATTEISKQLKDPVLINQYMGWSQRGNTRLRYQHYSNNDAIEAMLIADGVLLSPDAIKKKKDLLKPKICPNCDEPNRPDSRICSKCRFVMTFDQWNETIQEAERRQKELEELEKRQQELEKSVRKAWETIDKGLESGSMTLDLASKIPEMAIEKKIEGGWISATRAWGNPQEEKAEEIKKEMKNKQQKKRTEYTMKITEDELKAVILNLIRSEQQERQQKQQQQQA